MPIPWNESDEYKVYLDHISLISADTRLQLIEEELFLNKLNQSDPQVINRLSVLKAAKSLENSDQKILQVSVARSAAPAPFDSVDDDSYSKSTGTSLAGGTLSLGTYSPPGEGFGTGAVRFIGKLLGDKGLTVTGISASGLLGTSSAYCGFILCYELLCGHLSLRILEGDSPKYLGNMLFRSLPVDETMKPGILCSILRAAMRNPQISSELPSYHAEFVKKKEIYEQSNKPTGMFGQLQGMFQGSFDAAKQNAEFLQDVCKLLVAKHKLSPLVGTIINPPFTPSGSVRFVFLEAGSVDIRTYCLVHGLLVPDSANISCSSRHFTSVSIGSGAKIGADFGNLLKLDPESILSLSSVPMKPLGLGQFIRDMRAIQKQAEIELGATDADKLKKDFYEKFRIQKSSICESQNSKGIIDRLSRDWELSRRIEESKIPNELNGFSDADIRNMVMDPKKVAESLKQIESLRKALETLYETDVSQSQRCIEALLSLMSSVLGSSVHEKYFSLAHLAGQAPYCSFEIFTSFLLDQNFRGKLKEINPYLTDEDVQVAESLLVGTLFRLNRAGLVARGLANVSEITNLMSKLRALPQGERTPLFNDLSLKTISLAELLATRRGYMKIEADGSATYDPRFLLFEFTMNINLRDSQIALVNRFVKAFESGGSLCHQLIMGAGKTTVIAPLLALILGTTERLVVQVMYASTPISELSKS
jgi:hypothetical protein